MEKYGVTEQSEKKAEAQDEMVCPDCGKKLIDPEETGVLICPQCGSAPFEG